VRADLITKSQPDKSKMIADEKSDKSKWNWAIMVTTQKDNSWVQKIKKFFTNLDLDNSDTPNANDKK
jgi:hypothetical protein